MQNPQHAPTPGADRAATWRRYLRFFGARVDDDFDDELRFHLEMRARDYAERGLPPVAARAAAAERLGDMRRTRAECLTIAHRRERRMARTQTIDALRQDVTFALRTLGRQKGWTAIAVLTLALGIGANTAVFSVVNSLLLNPLGYRDASRVAMIWRSEPTSGIMMSPDNELVDGLRKNARSIETIVSYGTQDVTLTGFGDPRVLHAATIGTDFPGFVGNGIQLGRGFSKEEVQVNGPTVAILSPDVWQSDFAGQPGVLGRKITLNGKTYTVIGVASHRMRLPEMLQERTDLWLPLVNDPKARFASQAMTRLRPGITKQQAEKELDSVTARLNVGKPSTAANFVTSLNRPSDMVSFKQSLTLLWGAVALLLLVACANVAHLLLARGATRERELAIRTALGASRRRIVRQLLTESSLLALAGCLLGLAVGAGGLHAMVSLRPSSLTSLTHAEINGTVVIVTVAMSVVTGMIFGLVGAVHAARHATAESLKATATSGTGARRNYRLRSTLVITEMAVSTVLLVGAILLVRSVINLQRVDPGFKVEGLYSMSFALAGEQYRDESAQKAFAERLFEAARRVPGLEEVTLAGNMPPRVGFMVGALEAEGRALDPKASQFTGVNFVPSGFFALLRLPITHGATFTPGAADRNDAIINEGAAKVLWPGQNPMGKRFRLASRFVTKTPPRWTTVVGVTADAAVYGVGGERSRPLIYYPSESGTGLSGVTLAFRVHPGADPFAALHRMALDLDPTLPPPPVLSVEHEMDQSIAATRFTMTLLAIFAGLAVTLSAIGLYGVISYVVMQRTREIGIRIALGATPRHIARVVVAGGIVLSGVGLVVGLVGATWGTKLIATALYGVQATDPVSFLTTAVVLFAISVVACLVPMRRALAVDPLIAMRAD